MLGPTEIIAGSSGAFCVVRVMEDAGATNPGDPKTGLVASTIDISYWRQGAAAVTQLTEADATALNDAHDPSDVEEIGLGYYLVHLPDAAVAVGAEFVHIMATATDCIGYGPTITLTDPVGRLFKSYVIDSEPSTSVARVSEFTGYANDELNGELVWVYDSSANEWHPCWVTDFATTNGDFTLVACRGGGNIPFTVEAGVDRLWRSGLNRDGITDLDGLATASALATVDTVVDGITTTIGTAGDGLTEAGGTGDHLTAIDIFSISGDSTAADNLEAMYDGTGYTDDTGPASRAQVSGIGAGSGSALNFPVSADNQAGAIIDSVTKVGTQTGTYANTENNLSTFHQITHSGNAIDWVYEIDCGDIRTAVSLSIDAYLNSSNDSINIQVYDHVGTDWETIETLAGTNGSTVSSLTPKLFEKHTGVIGDAAAGKCYVRFVCSAQTSPVLYVARISASAVPATSTMGYEGGKVWANEATGTSTGTTLGIDGTFANQSDDFDNAQDIADALGTSFINIHPGDSVTLSDALEGYVISMVQVTLDGGSQNTGSTRFNEGTYTGVFARSSGFPTFSDGRLNNVTLPQFAAFRCGVAGTITLSEAANQSLIDCQGNGATIDCASLGSGLILNLARWAGTVTLNNIAANAIVNIYGSATGDVTLAGADGTVNIYGTVGSVTDNRTGSPVLTNSPISLANINAQVDTALSDYDGPTKAELDVLGTAALATSSALSTAQADLDIITGSDGVTLATSQANYAPATAAALTTHDGKLDTVDGLVDQLIAAVVTAQTEPGQGAPPVSASMDDKIAYLYKWARNRSNQTSTLWQGYADDATTVDQKRTLSDDGTTFESGEMVTGA